MFGIWDFFGIWCLELGAFPERHACHACHASNPGPGGEDLQICDLALGASPDRYGWYGCGTATGTAQTGKIPRVYRAWYGGTAKTLLCVPPLGLEFGAWDFFGVWGLELGISWRLALGAWSFPGTGLVCHGLSRVCHGFCHGSGSKKLPFYAGCHGVTGKTLLGVGGLPSLRHARFRIYTSIPIYTKRHHARGPHQTAPTQIIPRQSAPNRTRFFPQGRATSLRARRSPRYTSIIFTSPSASHICRSRTKRHQTAPSCTKLRQNLFLAPLTVDRGPWTADCGPRFEIAPEHNRTQPNTTEPGKIFKPTPMPGQIGKQMAKINPHIPAYPTYFSRTPGQSAGGSNTF